MVVLSFQNVAGPERSWDKVSVGVKAEWTKCQDSMLIIGRKDTVSRTEDKVDEGE
jgi:hypothetical protein